MATRPASTFKIINALIALEEGVLKDEKEIVKFVGIENVDTLAYGNRTDIFKGHGFGGGIYLKNQRYGSTWR